MPRKSLGRKRGIQQSIKRNTLGGKKVPRGKGDTTVTDDAGFLCFSPSNCYWFGLKCFEILLLSCEKFRLIGFESTVGGEYVLLKGRQRLVHYGAITWYFAIFLQKTLGTMHLLLYKDLRIESFICINLATIQIASVLCSLGIVMRPKETIDLLNSWSYVTLDHGRRSSPTKLNPLQDVTTCCKVVSIFLAAQGITVGAALLTLVMSDLPICLFPMADGLGWLPNDIFSSFAWQIIFTPLEWLMYFPHVSIAGFASAVLIMGTGALNVYLKPLRMADTNTMKSCQSLKQMYVQLELFNRIFQVWIRFFFPCFLLAYACGMIICLFITIRFTKLPFFVYILFPYVTMTLISLLFWQSYDMFYEIRGSEGILGGLLEQQDPYLMIKTRQDRVELMKRAKAMRPLGFPVADCEFSLSVPINTWEEVLNQVVFLLSLKFGDSLCL